MKKLIILLLMLFFTLNLVSSIEESNLLYSINLNYNNGDIAIEEIRLIEGLEPNYLEEGDYTLLIYSYKNEELFKTKFDFPLIELEDAPIEWFDENMTQVEFGDGSQTILEISSKVLFAPYFPNGKEIKVKKENELKLTIDISEFAVCNQNNICDSNELTNSCPEDCLKEESSSNVSDSFWEKIINWIKSLFKRS